MYKEKYDALIVCALKSEYDQVLKNYNWEEFALPNGYFVAKSVIKKDKQSIKFILAHQVEAGREATSKLVTVLDKYCDYNLLAMSGICAGRKEKVKLGDVIFANCLWNYESGKIDQNGKFEATPHQYHPTDIWLQRIQRISSNQKLNEVNEKHEIHCAPIATGDKVRRDKNIFSRLSNNMSHVLGIEMEASMVGSLAQNKNIPFIVAKGVSDYGDGEKNNDHHEIAAYNSAKCLIELLIDSCDLVKDKNQKRFHGEFDYLNDCTHICIPDSTGYALLMLKVVKFLNKPCILDGVSSDFKSMIAIADIATKNGIELISGPKRSGDKLLTKDEILRKPFPWDEFWKFDPLVSPEGIPELGINNSIVVVPQKLITDGTSRDTAEKQSFGWDYFDRLITAFNGRKMILGQHFDKNDEIQKKEIVDRCSQRNIIVPGMNNNSSILGMRGVSLGVWTEMYKKSDFIIGIAGTHTWQILTMYPKHPQIILSNITSNEVYESFEYITKSLQNVIVIPFSPYPEGNQIDIIEKKVHEAVSIIEKLYE